MIVNINPDLGDMITFSSLEEMEIAVMLCGYFPPDGLIEGRDYEEIEGSDNEDL